jgi:translation initiation factor IF-2
VFEATRFASSKERMSAVTSKIRIYDLAKDLKIDTKRLIEEVRREGVDVSVPSNSISKELAEKIRDKYFPKRRHGRQTRGPNREEGGAPCCRGTAR